MTIRGLQRLLMLLGSKAASDYRGLAETTFTRVMAGDRSLIKVIEANAVSNDAAPMAARSAMSNDPSPGGGISDDFLDNIILKRQRDKMFEIELEERMIEIEFKKAKVKAMCIENDGKQLEQQEKTKTIRDKDLVFFKNSMVLLQSINGGTLDDRTSLQYEDLVRNVTFTGNVKAISNGEPTASDGINVSVVAKSMGFTYSNTQLSAIGRAMTKTYLQKYNEIPSKHNQFVNGLVCPVNSYMERDRDMLEQVIRNYIPEPKGEKLRGRNAKSKVNVTVDST